MKGRIALIMISMLMLISMAAVAQEPILAQDACDTSGCYFKITYPEGAPLPLYVAWVLDSGELKLTKATETFLLTADHMGTKEVRANLIYQFDASLSKAVVVMFPSNPWKNFMDQVTEMAMNPVVIAIAAVIVAVSAYITLY